MKGTQGCCRAALGLSVMNGTHRQPWMPSLPPLAHTYILFVTNAHAVKTSSTQTHTHVGLPHLCAGHITEEGAQRS